MIRIQLQGNIIWRYDLSGSGSINVYDILEVANTGITSAASIESVYWQISLAYDAETSHH